MNLDDFKMLFISYLFKSVIFMRKKKESQIRRKMEENFFFFYCDNLYTCRSR